MSDQRESTKEIVIHLLATAAGRQAITERILEMRDLGKVSDERAASVLATVGIAELLYRKEGA